MLSSSIRSALRRLAATRIAVRTWDSSYPIASSYTNTLAPLLSLSIIQARTVQEAREGGLVFGLRLTLKSRSFETVITVPRTSPSSRTAKTERFIHSSSEWLTWGSTQTGKPKAAAWLSTWKQRRPHRAASRKQQGGISF